MASSSYTPVVVGTGLKATVQRVGGYLAGMVMPNIGAFIAWGLITALFIPTGWLPNARFAALVVPMITFLIPVLIGYTGGRAVHGQRGAVVGAVATVGIIVGSNVPMILGAMIVGPLTAYLLKRFDAFTEDRIRPGFEMLVENFSAGILGGGMAVLGVWVIGPVVRAGTTGTGHGVEWLVNHHLLPFASFLIEPGKVLFLNNAINHGVLGPLGVAQAAEHGKSVLFMLESNPGPGLGVLLAYLLFGPRLLRPTVPAAIIIQFFGGCARAGRGGGGSRHRSGWAGRRAGGAQTQGTAFAACGRPVGGRHDDRGVPDQDGGVRRHGEHQRRGRAQARGGLRRGHGQQRDAGQPVA